MTTLRGGLAGGWVARGLAAAASLALLALVAGCGRQSPPPAAPASSAAPPPAPFTILAGSELRDLEGDLRKTAQGGGVAIDLKYAGTLDIVERVNAGEKFDAVLPPNGAYPALALTTKPLAREKLFYSRVAIGVKEAKARALGWDRQPPTWADIARAVKRGAFTYGMTNPSASNTGMSALFAVAAAAAKKTEDLTAKDVDATLLKDFLAGQKITAGSSGWLADVYARDPSAVDGLVNYEAVLLRLNEKLPADARLTIVYPKDGVISADYPLMLLNGARRDDYNKLVAAFKGAAFQGQAVAAAFLRPSSPEVATAPALPTAAVAELSFPNRLEVIDEILSTYLEQWRRPATSIFVLDTSGSMKGQRIADMKQALNVLAGVDAGTASGRFMRFQSRERVVLIRFSNYVREPDVVVFGDQPEASRKHVLDVSSGLEPNGGTAIYTALQRALRQAEEELKREPQRHVSIVLLTDGENNTGMSFNEFTGQFPKQLGVRIFPILFGEGNVDEMKRLAELSGGRTFDARHASLPVVFKEIRGYQ